MVVRKRRKTMGIGSGGIILIDRRGKIEYAHNATYMPVCYVTVKSDPDNSGVKDVSSLIKPNSILAFTQVSGEFLTGSIGRLRRFH